MKIINKRNAYLGKKVKLIEFSFFTYEVLNEMKIKICEKESYTIPLRNISEFTIIYISYENFIESIKDGSIKIL